LRESLLCGIGGEESGLQLDKTRIAIRERGFADILDLTLRVIRADGAGLLVTWLVGALPFALLNYYLLQERMFMAELEPEITPGYLWYSVILVLAEIPLATAPMTIYLGQTLFMETTSGKKIGRQIFSRLPQIIFLQIMVRGLFSMLAVWGYVKFGNEELQVLMGLGIVLGWMLFYVFWPYLNEILLLECNPLRKSDPAPGTISRMFSLHGSATAELFTRWLGSAVVAAGLIGSLWLSFYSIRSALTFAADFDATFYGVFLPLAMWITVGFFTVARFLSYLDLRIRTEGWEIELAMRAEGERIARQLA
jgi:hypothetical protein